MKHLIKILLLAICLTPCRAQADIPSIFDQFTHTEVLKLQLELNMDTLFAKVRTNEEYPAVFRYQDAHGAWVELLSDVRARGRYRRRTCDFPPLRIDFSKKDLRARGLLDFDDLKLVTHCMNGAKGKEAVLREYLVYKLYSELTDYALRAQLVEVTYIDSKSGKKDTKYGILLEDIDELAARQGAEECDECYGLSTVDFQQDNLRTHDMFQYMIGNVDWSLPMARNLKILRPVQGTLYTVVPYDFDFSGLVDVAYAVPNQDVGQTEVGERVYLGAARSRQELQTTIDLFRSKQEALRSRIENFGLLNRRSRREMLDYLDTFYQALAETETAVCDTILSQRCSNPGGK